MENANKRALYILVCLEKCIFNDNKVLTQKNPKRIASNKNTIDKKFQIIGFMSSIVLVTLVRN